MNILTDVLSLLKRGKLIKKAKSNDVIPIGIHEKPDMTGVASPIPYKSVKLIKVSDLKVPADVCTFVNVPTGNLTSTAGVYKDTVIDPETEDCTVNLRKLKSLSLNLSVAENGDYLEINTLGEPNTGENLWGQSVGDGSGVFAQKSGETLQFKSLKGDGVTVSNNTHQITIGPATEVRLSSPNGTVYRLTVADDGTLGTEAV